MQRLHEDDLSAYLTNNENWELLKIPAIAQDDMYFKIHQRKYYFPQGECLNKMRDNKSYMNNLESEMGSRNFSAQYLQNPLPSNYNLLNSKDIAHYDTLPEFFEYYIHSWDTAIKTSINSDYTVGTIWGISNNYYYLIDMIRKKMTYPDMKYSIEKQIKKYKPRYVLIEDKASGQSVIQDLKLSGYENIRPIRPNLDKVTRFASVVNFFNSSIVKVPNSAVYLRYFINEITNFPNSNYDDIVDSVSQFLNFIKQKKNIAEKRIRSL